MFENLKICDGRFAFIPNKSSIVSAISLIFVNPRIIDGFRSIYFHFKQHEACFLKVTVQSLLSNACDQFLRVTSQPYFDKFAFLRQKQFQWQHPCQHTVSGQTSRAIGISSNKPQSKRLSLHWKYQEG